MLPLAVNLKEDFLGECNRNQRRSVPGNGPGRCDSSAHKCRICQLIKRFPVPDGDTGTNMNLSMTSGAKAVADSRSEKVGELAGALSKGLLMGARGNSGVILSQLFRGFSKQIPEVTTLNAKDLAAAFTWCRNSV